MFNNLSIASILFKKEAHPLDDRPQDVLQIAFALQSRIYSAKPSTKVFSLGKHIFIFFIKKPSKTQKQEAHLH